MPILLWIAFWSSVTGIAKGWQETVLPVRVKVRDRRDQPPKVRLQEISCRRYVVARDL